LTPSLSNISLIQIADHWIGDLFIGLFTLSGRFAFLAFFTFLAWFGVLCSILFFFFFTGSELIPPDRGFIIVE